MSTKQIIELIEVTKYINTIINGLNEIDTSIINNLNNINKQINEKIIELIQKPEFLKLINSKIRISKKNKDKINE